MKDFGSAWTPWTFSLGENLSKKLTFAEPGRRSRLPFRKAIELQSTVSDGWRLSYLKEMDESLGEFGS